MTEATTPTNDAKLKAVRALKKAQYQMDNAKLDETGHQHKYATLKSVRDAVRKPLHDNGFAVLHTANRLEDGSPFVDTMLMHEDGGTFSTRIFYKRPTNNDQQTGAGISYAKRYGLVMLCAISAGNEDKSIEMQKPDTSNVNKSGNRNTIRTFRVYNSDGKVKEHAELQGAVMYLNQIVGKNLATFKGEELKNQKKKLETNNAELLQKLKDPKLDDHSIKVQHELLMENFAKMGVSDGQDK